MKSDSLKEFWAENLKGFLSIILYIASSSYFFDVLLAILLHIWIDHWCVCTWQVLIELEYNNLRMLAHSWYWACQSPFFGMPSKFSLYLLLANTYKLWCFIDESKIDTSLVNDFIFSRDPVNLFLFRRPGLGESKNWVSWNWQKIATQSEFTFDKFVFWWCQYHLHVIISCFHSCKLFALVFFHRLRRRYFAINLFGLFVFI